MPLKWCGARIADIGLQEQDAITTLNFQFTINVLVNVMTTGTLGCRKTISFAVMEKEKQMDELLQNIQDFTDEIASTIRLAIWLQIMSENALEVKDDTD